MTPTKKNKIHHISVLFFFFIVCEEYNTRVVLQTTDYDKETTNKNNVEKRFVIIERG